MANSAVMEDLLERILRELQGSNRGSAQNLANLARRSGVDPRVVQQTENRLRTLGDRAQDVSSSQSTVSKAGSILGGVLGDVANSAVKTAGNLVKLGTSAAMGEGTVADVFSAFKDLPFGIGTVAQGLAALAKMQQDNLDAFRDLAKGGVNFGESLTTLRNNSIELGLSMQQMVGLFRENGETFRLMGTTANEGAKNFRNLNLELVNNKRGLAGLGFSYEELNQLTARYARSIGGLSADQQKDYKRVADSAAAYGEQLDLLARLTGKSREQIAKELEESQAEANFQAYLSTLDEKTREKLNLSITEAQKVAGKGGADIVKAQALGIAVQTEAGKNVAATMGRTTELINKSAKEAMNTNISLDEMRAGQARRMAEQSIAAGKDYQRLGKTMAILGMTGDKLAGDLTGVANTVVGLNKNNITTIEQQEAIIKAEKEKQQQDKQRKEAAEAAEDAMRKFKTTMNSITPVLIDNILNPAMNWFANNAGTIANTVKEYSLKASEFVQMLFSEDGRQQILSNIEEWIKKMFGQLLDTVSNYISNKIGGLSPETKGAVNTGVSVAGGAAMGAVVGSVVPGIGTGIGAAVGAGAGLIVGLGEYLWEKMSGSGRSEGTLGATGKLFEDFGKGTPILAHGTEGVFKPGQIESLMSSAAGSGVKEAINSLNSTQQQLLDTMKAVAEYTRRNVDATKSLSNNAFA